MKTIQGILCRAVLLGIVATGLLHSRTAVADESDAPLNVVLLYSGDFFIPAAVIQDQAMRTAFTAGTKRSVNFYVETLYANNLSAVDFDVEFANFMRRKYQGQKIDLIVSVATPALNFLERHRSELWPEAPAMFFSVDETGNANRKFPPGMTGLTIKLDPATTLDLALQLQPKAHQVVVVTGASESDHFWLPEIQSQLQSHHPTLSTTYLTNQTMAELAAELGKLPADTVVLYTTVFTDSSGKRYVPRDVVARLSAASAAPIFGLYETMLDHGIVGGVMPNLEEHGRRAGELGLRLIAGEKPDDIPVPPAAAGIPIVDWRQLRRWNISESRLPPGSMMRFRPLTLWENYKNYVIAALCIIMAQAATIAALLVHRARRRRAEAAVRESELRFRNMADTAPVMIWMSASDKKCIYFNRRWLDFTGRPLEAEVGDGWVANVHPDDLGPRVVGYREAFDSRMPLTVEYRLRRHDGQYRWVLAQAVPRLTAGGEFLGYVGSCVDITDRKQAEETHRDLAHVARVSTMGQLASALAHELNQPLGAILRNAEAGELILNQNAPDYEEVRAILVDIRHDDQRAGAVIDRMRSLLKRGSLEFEPLPVKQLLDQVAVLVRAEMQTRKVILQVAVPNDLPPVHGDRVHLQQVLLNLLVNGADAVNGSNIGQRRLEVQACHAGRQMVEMAVRDTGHGIPEEKLAQIFEPFVTTKSNGMGMGLAISKTIVEAHGGRIWAENNDDGGAIFRFTLKIAGQGSST